MSVLLCVVLIEVERRGALLMELPVDGKRIEVVLIIRMPVFVYASKAKN